MSFLRTAAVAALAGTSGRNLGATSGCLDDVCGDPIHTLTWTEDSGHPTISADGNTDTLLQIRMEDNKIPGLVNNLGESTLSIEGTNIRARVHLRTSEGYNDADHDCALSVTMAKAEGTSATFAEHHGLSDPDVVTVPTATKDGFYLDALIRAPTIESGLAVNSLGDVVANIQMKLTCNDPTNNLDPQDIPLLTNAETNTFQAKYTFVRDADKDERWTWEVGKDDNGVTSGLNQTQITGEHKHQSRTVTVAGQSVVIGGQRAPIRFPKGKWATYNSAPSDEKDPDGNIDYKGTLTCAVVATPETEAEGEFFADYKGFVTNWYESKNQIPSNTFSYDAGVDANCLPDDVCDKRIHRAEQTPGTAGFRFDTALGFEAPYLEYFQADPQISCTTSDDLAGTPQKDITGIASTKGTDDGGEEYWIGSGQFKTGYSAFSVSSEPSAAVQKAKETTDNGGDYGDDFFNGADIKFMGASQLFEHTEATAYWRHVSDGFDFNVKIKNSIGDDYTPTSGSGLYYAGATDEAGVKSKVDGIIGALDAKDVPRPTLYGETRDQYTVCATNTAGQCDDEATTATSTVMFRRDSSNINIILNKASDGETLTHSQDKTLSDTSINFPGPNIKWKPFSATVSRSFALAEGTVITAVTDYDGDSTSAKFLTHYDSDTARDTALFVGKGVFAESNNCATQTATPWCRMAGTGSTVSAPFLCYASSVTAKRTVTKDSQDDRRVASPQEVSRTYTRAAASRPDANEWFTNSEPESAEDDYFVDGDAKNVGATLATQVYSVVSADMLGNNVDLDFSPQNTGKLAFNCHLSTQNTETFTATYKDPCTDLDQTHTLSVDVDVAYADVTTDSSYLTQTVDKVTVNEQASITEWDLQRKKTALKFRVKSLKRIAAKHFGSDGFIFTSKYMGRGDAIKTTCTGSAGNYACALTVPADETHDEKQLAHGEACCKKDERGQACSTETDAVECPYVEITATASVWDRKNCNAPKARPNEPLRFLANTGADATGTSYKVYLPLVGSDEVYDGTVTVKNIGADDQVRPIASVDAQDASTALVPGADGQYRTELKIPSGVVQPVLKGKQYAIEFAKHTARGDYVIQSLGEELLLCDKQTFSDNKCRDATTSLEGGHTLTLKDASETTVYVRMASDAEPCTGKFQDEDAYDGNFNFTIRRKTSDGDLELPHIYHVPVQCGTPQLNAIAWDDKQKDGSAWYKKTYRVQLTGSALAKDATQLLIEKTADEDKVVRSTLSFPDAAKIERDDDGMWQTLDEVQFSQLCTQSSKAATATVTAPGFSLDAKHKGNITFDCPVVPLKLIYGPGTETVISSSGSNVISTVKPDAIEGNELTIKTLRLSRGAEFDRDVSDFDFNKDAPVEITTDGVTFVEGSEIPSEPWSTPAMKIYIDPEECTESLIVVEIRSKITKDEPGEGSDGNGWKTVQLRVPCPRATLELYAKGAQVAKDQLLTPSAYDLDDRSVVTFNQMFLKHRDFNHPDFDAQVDIDTQAFPAGVDEELEFSDDQIGDAPGFVSFRFKNGGAQCDFVTVTMTSKRYEYQYSKDGAGAVTEDVTFYMACPKAKLQLFQGDTEVVGNPILVGEETADDNVVTFAGDQALYLKNRDANLKILNVKDISGTPNAGGDSVAFVYDYGIGDDFDTERQPVGIRFLPAEGATSLTCSFMNISISAQRTKEEKAEIVKFRMKCPHTELELYVGDQKVEEGGLLKPETEDGDIVTFKDMRLHHRDATMDNADKKVTLEWKTLPEDFTDAVVFVDGDLALSDSARNVQFKFANGGADCDFVELTFTSKQYNYLNPANGGVRVEGGKVVTFYMACPNTQLRLFQGSEEVQQNALIAADTFLGTIVRFESLYLVNRDGNLTGKSKKVKIEGRANAGGDKVAFEYTDYGIGDDFDDKRQLVGIEFKPANKKSLTCNFMQITISARRTRFEKPEKVSFRVQCPRVKDVELKKDKLSLDYTIEALTFGLGAASIKLPKTPALKSRPLRTKAVGFTADGVCDQAGIPKDLAFKDTEENKHAQCDLQDAIGKVKPYKSASQMMSVIEDCGGKMNWNEQISGVETITSKGYVTRVYQRQHPFQDKKFDYHCGVSTVSLQVVRSATKTTTVAVQSAPAVDFGVYVARAEFTRCKKPGQQRLEADIDTVYKDTKNSPKGAFLTAGLELQHMSASVGDKPIFKQMGSDGTSQLQYKSQCASGDALKALQEVGITFELVRKHLGLVHTGTASVGLAVLLEEDEEGAIATIDVKKDVLVTQTCASGFNSGDRKKGKYAPCGAKGAAIPATDDLKLAISIINDEKTAFAHEYGKPQYRIGEGGTYAPVESLTSEYVTQRGEPLVSADADTGRDNAVVALRALPFAGESAVYIQWKVSRVERAYPRLRRLLTVTYALGADGSVSKSSSFSVAPALRESSGASAVGDQTVELITDKELPEGTERTTEVLKEKQDKDEGPEGPMVGMIVAVSVLGVGVIALLVIVAVQGRKKDDDKSGGSSGRGESAELLWKTNRFTGEAF